MENDKSDPKNPWWQPGVILFGRLSGWIVGPILLGVFIGKWLDKKYNTEPWLFLFSVGIAFFLSTFGIVHDSMKELKRIEREEEKNKKNKFEVK
jgi:F0F1-type ATP synthase assembly protein I